MAAHQRRHRRPVGITNASASKVRNKNASTKAITIDSIVSPRTAWPKASDCATARGLTGPPAWRKDRPGRGASSARFSSAHVMEYNGFRAIPELENGISPTLQSSAEPPMAWPIITRRRRPLVWARSGCPPKPDYYRPTGNIHQHQAIPPVGGRQARRAGVIHVAVSPQLPDPHVNSLGPEAKWRAGPSRGRLSGGTRPGRIRPLDERPIVQCQQKLPVHKRDGNRRFAVDGPLLLSPVPRLLVSLPILSPAC